MLSYFRSLFSSTSRRQLYKQSKHFSSKPLNTTTPSTPSAFDKQISAVAQRHLDQLKEHYQIQNDTEFQQIVGKVKDAWLLKICFYLFRNTWLMKESAAYLKAKMTMLVKLGEACMQRILHVISKSKAFMLQTISMIWKNTSSNQSEPILYSETSSYFDLRSPMIFDGTSDIQCLYDDWRLVTLSQHELDLVKRICLELRLVFTHTLNCEEAMMAFGKVYDTWLASKS